MSNREKNLKREFSKDYRNEINLFSPHKLNKRSSFSPPNLMRKNINLQTEIDSKEDEKFVLNENPITAEDNCTNSNNKKLRIIGNYQLI